MSLKGKDFTLRYIHVAIFFILCACIISFRLFNIQIIEHQNIETKIDNKLQRTTLSLSARGKVFTRDGVVIAEDLPCYQLSIKLTDLQLSFGIIEEIDFHINHKKRKYRKHKTIQHTPKRELLSKIRNILPRLITDPMIHRVCNDLNLEPEKLAREIQKTLINTLKRWAYLSQNQLLDIFITENQANELIKRPIFFIGFSFVKSSIRNYPMKEVGAHLIGHLGPITEKEFNIIRMRGYHPVTNPKKTIVLTELERHNLHLTNNYTIGKMGIEKIKNQFLRGRLSKKVTKRSGENIPEKEYLEFDGENLRTTLDSKLQKLAFNLLNESESQKGAIFMFNIHSGEILVAASLPSFDPNFLSPPHDNTYIRDAHKQEGLFVNRCHEALYPFGSVYKIITAVAALEEGITQPSTKIPCHKVHPRTKLTCLGYHNDTNVARALEKSCNIYFYDVALELGVIKLHNWALNFNLGSLSNCGFPNESKGIIPSPSYKRKVSSEIWYPGETCHSAIGQGYQLGTVLQAAVIPALIASHQITAPHYWKHKNIKKLSINIKESTRNAIKKGLWQVVNANGTARHSISEKVIYAGKTGTADVYRHIPHAWFSGYAPFDNPQVAIAVFVENGGHGGEVAAPLAKVVLEAWQERYYNVFK